MREPLFEHRLSLAGYDTRALELEGEGPALVLLHGYMDSADTWRRTLDRVARSGRAALALDLPGFGTADRLRDGAVLPQLDHFTAAAAEHLAGERGEDVILVGNSLGGVAVLRAGENADLPLAGIVPVAPAGLDMPTWFSAIEGDPIVRSVLRLPLPEPLVEGMVGEAYRRLAFASPGAAPAGAVKAFALHHRKRESLARGLATGRRMLPELRYPFHLEHVTVPTLLIWGDRDRMVSHEGADRLLAGVGDIEYVELEGIGHCPQVEASDRFADLLLGFAPGEGARAARASA